MAELLTSNLKRETCSTLHVTSRTKRFRYSSTPDKCGPESGSDLLGVGSRSGRKRDNSVQKTINYLLNTGVFAHSKVVYMSNNELCIRTLHHKVSEGLFCFEI